MQILRSTLVGLTFMWLGSMTSQAIAQLDTQENYFLAKYSQSVNFSSLNSISPEVPSRITARVYYVQYGDASAIELTDPGEELSMIPVVKTTWNYHAGLMTTEMIFRAVKKYYIVTDSIPLEIEVSRNTVTNACISSIESSQCDSIIVTSSVIEGQYLVVLTAGLPNVKFYKLFYPDVKNLPKLIRRKDVNRPPLVFDEIQYGKPSVDLLLSSFSHDGYEWVTEEEMNSYELSVPKETLQELYKMEGTRINKRKLSH